MQWNMPCFWPGCQRNSEHIQNIFLYFDGLFKLVGSLKTNPQTIPLQTSILATTVSEIKKMKKKKKSK